MRGSEKRGGETRQKEKQTFELYSSPSPLSKVITFGCLRLTMVTVKCTESRSLQRTIKLPVRRGWSFSCDLSKCPSARPLGLGHLNGMELDLIEFAVRGDDFTFLRFKKIKSIRSLEEGFFSVFPTEIASISIPCLKRPSPKFWLMTTALNELRNR